MAGHGGLATPTSIERGSTVTDRHRRLFAGALLVVATSVAACYSAAAPSAAPTSSAAPTTPAATTPAATATAFLIRTAPVQPQACMDALLGGKLSRNPGSGLAVTNGAEVIVVEWPFRYSAIEVEGRVMLRDETGKVVAREGDQITVGGGLGNQLWYACGPVTVTKAAG